MCVCTAQYLERGVGVSVSVYVGEKKERKKKRVGMCGSVDGGWRMGRKEEERREKREERERGSRERNGPRRGRGREKKPSDGWPERSPRVIARD